MEEIPFVQMPDYYTQLLKVSMNSMSAGQATLPEYILKTKSLEAVLARSFVDVDKDLRPEQILKVLGWRGFRDRLAAVFLEYKTKRRFPNRPNLNLVKPILKFEEDLRPYGLEGHSRAFLLGLYLEMVKVQEVKELKLYKNIEESATRFMAFATQGTKGRVARVDWVVLMASQLCSALGEKQMTEAFLEHKKFKNIYALLSDRQRSLFISNMAAYGASINEKDIFLGLRV